MKTCKGAEQLSLFGPDTLSGKMCPEPFPAGQKRGKISGSSLKRPAGSRTGPYLFLDLRPGGGNLLGPSWEQDSPSLGESSTLNTGPRPHNEDGVSSLSRILEEHPHPKYYLSKAACLGILRRAEKRGKELPLQLREALELQAGIRASSPSTSTREKKP